MNAPANECVEALALRLARQYGLRAEAYKLAVKGPDFAEWHDVPPSAWPLFVRVFCSECNRLWGG